MKKETNNRSLLLIAKDRDIKILAKNLEKTRESDLSGKQWRNLCKELLAWLKKEQKGRNISTGMLGSNKKALATKAEEAQAKTKQLKKDKRVEQKFLKSEIEKERSAKEYAENNAEELVRGQGKRVLDSNEVVNPDYCFVRYDALPVDIRSKIMRSARSDQGQIIIDALNGKK
jgi:hypothetical protein